MRRADCVKRAILQSVEADLQRLADIDGKQSRQHQKQKSEERYPAAREGSVNP